MAGQCEWAWEAGADQFRKKPEAGRGAKDCGAGCHFAEFLGAMDARTAGAATTSALKQTKAGTGVWERMERLSAPGCNK